MDILQALARSQAKEKPATQQHDYITDGVWEATLYRLGEDVSDYKDVQPCEREETLTMLEKQK